MNKQLQNSIDWQTENAEKQLQENDRLNKLVNELLPEFIPVVQEIETGIKTTQDNYGKYLQVLSMFNDNNKRNLVCLVLLRAGGNVNGIRSAMGIING